VNPVSPFQFAAGVKTSPSSAPAANSVPAVTGTPATVSVPQSAGGTVKNVTPSSGQTRKDAKRLNSAAVKAMAVSSSAERMKSVPSPYAAIR